MKIRPDHVEYMRARVAPLDTPAAREAYKAAGASHKRYRWDLSYAARLTPWVCAEIYPYANDDHLDTALRAIVPPFN